MDHFFPDTAAWLRLTSVLLVACLLSQIAFTGIAHSALTTKTLERDIFTTNALNLSAAAATFEPDRLTANAHRLFYKRFPEAAGPTFALTGNHERRTLLARYDALDIRVPWVWLIPTVYLADGMVMLDELRDPAQLKGSRFRFSWRQFFMYLTTGNAGHALGGNLSVSLFPFRRAFQSAFAHELGHILLIKIDPSRGRKFRNFSWSTWDHLTGGVRALYIIAGGISVAASTFMAFGFLGGLFPGAGFYTLALLTVPAIVLGGAFSLFIGQGFLARWKELRQGKHPLFFHPGRRWSVISMYSTENPDEEGAELFAAAMLHGPELVELARDLRALKSKVNQLRPLFRKEHFERPILLAAGQWAPAWTGLWLITFGHAVLFALLVFGVNIPVWDWLVRFALWVFVSSALAAPGNPVKKLANSWRALRPAKDFSSWRKYSTVLVYQAASDMRRLLAPMMLVLFALFIWAPNELGFRVPKPESLPAFSIRELPRALSPEGLQDSWAALRGPAGEPAEKNKSTTYLGRVIDSLKALAPVDNPPVPSSVLSHATKLVYGSDIPRLVHWDKTTTPFPPRGVSAYLPYWHYATLLTADLGNAKKIRVHLTTFAAGIVTVHWGVGNVPLTEVVVSGKTFDFAIPDKVRESPQLDLYFEIQSPIEARLGNELIDYIVGLEALPEQVLRPKTRRKKSSDKHAGLLFQGA